MVTVFHQCALEITSSKCVFMAFYFLCRTPKCFYPQGTAEVQGFVVLLDTGTLQWFDLFDLMTYCSRSSDVRSEMMLVCRSGTSGWLHLQSNRRSSATQTRPPRGPQPAAMLAGTFTWLLEGKPPSLKSLMRGSKRVKISSTQVDSVEKTPRVATLHRWGPGGTGGSLFVPVSSHSSVV